MMICEIEFVIFEVVGYGTTQAIQLLLSQCKKK